MSQPIYQKDIDMGHIGETLLSAFETLEFETN